VNEIPVEIEVNIEKAHNHGTAVIRRKPDNMNTSNCILHFTVSTKQN